MIGRSSSTAPATRVAANIPTTPSPPPSRKDVSQHVELFVGDADDILDPKMSDRLAASLPDCTRRVWPGAGHYGVYAHWKEFLRAFV